MDHIVKLYREEKANVVAFSLALLCLCCLVHFPIFFIFHIKLLSSVGKFVKIFTKLVFRAQKPFPCLINVN